MQGIPPSTLAEPDTSLVEELQRLRAENKALQAKLSEAEADAKAAADKARPLLAPSRIQSFWLLLVSAELHTESSNFRARLS